MSPALMSPRYCFFEACLGSHSSDFTPQLLQLGLAKSQTSLVWIAAPLSGLIVQPVIGTISDSTTLRWGRRRPYIFGGAILVAVFLCILAWSTEIVSWLAWSEGVVSMRTVAMHKLADRE